MSEEGTGDILIEVEPIRYEIDIHSSIRADDEPRQRSKKIVRSDVVLAKSSLFRFDEAKTLRQECKKCFPTNMKSQSIMARYV